MDRHKYAVTSVSWFPFDTGMFVTSSYDTTIKVWDTNEMKVKKKKKHLIDSILLTSGSFFTIYI